MDTHDWTFGKALQTSVKAQLLVELVNLNPIIKASLQLDRKYFSRF